MQDLKIIDYSSCWECENMDLLAPITREGTIYLLSNNTYKKVWNNETWQGLAFATEDEKKLFYQKLGHLFVGQAVEIIGGRTLPHNTIKRIKEFFRFDIAGTYGHQYTDYVVFEDNTKINIKHIKPICELFENVANFKEHKRIKFGGRL